MQLSTIIRRRALLSGAAVSLVLAATFAAWPALVRYARGPAAGESSLEQISVHGQVP